MKIEQYDRVQLKSGEYAYIVEFFDDGKAFLADIDRDDGTVTDWVKPEDIAQVLKPELYMVQDDTFDIGKVPAPGKSDEERAFDAEVLAYIKKTFLNRK